MAESYVAVAVLDREVNDSYYPKRKYRANVQFYRVARHTVVTFLESIVFFLHIIKDLIPLQNICCWTIQKQVGVEVG